MAVLHTQALLDRAEAWSGQPLEQRRSPAGLTELAALYAAITGEPAGSCRQCQYSDYHAVVQAYVRRFSPSTASAMSQTSKFALAKGFENESFVHEGHGKVVTAENLTDADAEFFIKNGFRHAFLKDGKPLPAPKDAGTAEEPASTPDGGEGTAKLTEKQQLQARYKDLHGEDAPESLTIAKLREANDAKQADLDEQRD